MSGMTKKQYYAGIRFAPYDLVRELLVVLLIIGGIVAVLSATLSSPDVPPLTLKTIALSSPSGYLQGAISELDGTSDTATYGPPYNKITPDTGGVQNFGFFSPQKWLGIHIPINTATTYVLDPLKRAAGADPSLRTALKQFNGAGSSRQGKWEQSYSSALGRATQKADRLTVPSCACGPVRLMMSRMLALGQSGAMDGLLLTSGHFYQTDYTRSVLFAADTGALDDEATKYGLQGDTWGAMNETGNYPGQEWLWLFSAFYQIAPYNVPLAVGGLVIDWTANADLMAVMTITLVTLILLFLPWIPGLNQLPQRLGVYRLIWRDYYREQSHLGPSPAPATSRQEAGR